VNFRKVTKNSTELIDRLDKMGKTKHKKHHRDENGGDDETNAGLKLVLKVGSKGHEKHKKKKKKKDKKKERDKERGKHHHHHKEKRLDSGTNNPEIKSEVKIEEPDEDSPKKALTRLLEQMLNHLQKKDTHGFFVNPVNDQIAPGYSSIISQPMDFSSMRMKLADYDSLAVFRTDFELICRNAMTYNTVDTIYYKSADKLLRYGQKFFSVEKLRSMKTHLAFASVIPDECLGIDASSVLANEENNENDDEDADDDVGDVSKVIEDIREHVVKRPPGRFEAIPDDLTSIEILEQAKMAAKGAANRLKIYKPKSKMGFLRQKPDGSTSLKFLTGNSGIVPGAENNERPVTLGTLIGKVKQGSGSIQGFREDRRNLTKSMHPLYYGAYSTHGPSYDSTFANLTKEETELVHSTYCDPAGVQYAESVLNFSRNCDYAMYVVDHLLDILTGNEHRKTSKYIEEMKNLRKEDELLDNAFKDIPVNSEDKQDASKKDIDFTSLKSLEKDGIDMSFLDTLQKYCDDQNVMGSTDIKTEDTKPPEGLELLQTNAQLIDQLKIVQNERLSGTPPPHFSQLQKPTEKETELAANIQSNLVEMVGQVKPNQVLPEAAIRAVMGIKAPLPLTTSQEPMDVE